jgi:hypothetical protein
MNQSFSLAFWHPFGPHGRETPHEIIDRKLSEIRVNGWTLWSFQHRPMLAAWQRQLSTVQGTIPVFCSDSAGALDPARDGRGRIPILCQSYKYVEALQNDQWQPMPNAVKIPHPFSAAKGKGLASAFVVANIVSPFEIRESVPVEWFSASGEWRQDRVPTRGEYLIRCGGASPMRRVRALLELKPPYLAIVSVENAKTQ